MSAKQVRRVLAVLAVGMAFWAGSAQAATITGETTGYYNVAYPTVSATDLVNSGQATFLTLNVNNDPSYPDPTGRWSYPTDWNNGSYTRLNDGVSTGGGYNAGWASSHHDPPNTTAAFQIFTFDNSANPNGPYGYDITSIVTTSMDRDGRSWQFYLLEYHKVGDPAGTWTTVAGGNGSGGRFQSGTTNSNQGAYSWRQMTITFGTGELTQVDQIRFTTPRYTSGTKGCTSWAEIDIFGVPSVPEPATLALLGFGGVGLLLGRKRR